MVMTRGKQDSKLNEHLFEYKDVEKKRLAISLVITISIMLVEVAGGIFFNSIALISDAGHMFTHAFAISIGLLAIYISRNPPCHHKTYGMYRAEILAAFINGLFLLVMVGIILYEAIERLLAPAEIDGIYMLLVAIVGLIANISSIFLLHGSKKEDLNVKSIFYHMVADAAASVGIVIGAIIIIFNPFLSILDPLLSFAISIIIIFWAWGILKESGRILLEMAPEGLDIHQIEEELVKTFEQVESLNNVHLWSITSNILVFSATVKLKDGIFTTIQEQDVFIERVNAFLLEHYDIVEATIQVTLKENLQACALEQL